MCQKERHAEPNADAMVGTPERTETDGKQSSRKNHWREICRRRSGASQRGSRPRHGGFREREDPGARTTTTRKMPSK